MNITQCLLIAFVLMPADKRGDSARTEVEPVLASLRSEMQSDVLGTCWYIKHHSWSPNETEIIAAELAAMINRYDNVDFVLEAADHLIKLNPKLREVFCRSISTAVSIERVHGGEWTRRRDICRIIAWIGREGNCSSLMEHDLQILVRHEKEFPFVAIRAAGALVKTRRYKKMAVDLLCKRVSDDRSVVAADAIRDAGPSAQVAIPVLRGMIQRGSSAERVVAGGALWEVEGKPSPDVVNVLCTALEETPIGLLLEPGGVSPPSMTHSLYAAVTLGKKARPDGAIHHRLLALRCKLRDPRQQQLLNLALTRIAARRTICSKARNRFMSEKQVPKSEKQDSTTKVKPPEAGRAPRGPRP